MSQYGPVDDVLVWFNSLYYQLYQILICYLSPTASMLIGSAVNLWMIYLGRGLIGACIGLLSLTMPIYLGETIQAEIRGILGLLPTSVGNGGSS